MQPWTILVWNMALMSRGSRSTEDNMRYLTDLMMRHDVDVALLSEAPVAYLRELNEDAGGSPNLEPAVFSKGGTTGLDYWTDEHKVRKLKKRKRWSAAIVSRHGPVELGERDVRAVSPSRQKRRPDVPFGPSRPGSWIAATVEKEGEALTCVSLYGLMDELSDASMHRSLSEASPVFSDPDHNEHVILGGDFNIGTSLEGQEVRERSQLVLNRIVAYGLENCLATWREEHAVPKLPNCPCADEPCRHTLTRLIPTDSGDPTPWQDRTPFQVDYLFASTALVEEGHLDEVIESSPDEWEHFSDHAPLVVRLHT